GRGSGGLGPDNGGDVGRSYISERPVAPNGDELVVHLAGYFVGSARLLYLVRRQPRFYHRLERGLFAALLCNLLLTLLFRGIDALFRQVNHCTCTTACFGKR